MTRIARAIERVGLTTAADRRVDGYSAGMRQRLGPGGRPAARASPPVARRTDERARSGRGARRAHADSRAGRRGHRDRHLSSHDLLEVEELCASVTILRAGELVFTGSLEHLRARAGATPTTWPRATTTRRWRSRATVAASVRHARATARTDSTPSANDDAVDAYIVALGRAGIAVRVLQPRERSLESVFLRLTRTGAHP